MRELVHVLLYEPNSLASADRELIATYVSSLNDCFFCQASHGAAAACHLGDTHTVAMVKADPSNAPISEKLKRLLGIAAKVQQGGKQVTEADVQAARDRGATDAEIHDTVLIAAAFCMFNRYVDGLATWQPHEDAMYLQMGAHLAREGYRTSSQTPRSVGELSEQ